MKADWKKAFRPGNDHSSNDGSEVMTAVALDTAGPVAPTSSTRLIILRRLAGDRMVIVALGIIMIVVGFCYFGPLFWHLSPDATDPLSLVAAPSLHHPLGTDDVGRDVLARLMVGGRISLQVGIIAGLLGTVIGVAYGSVAGYFGGIVDAVMMRIVDAVISIPVLVLLILLSAVIRPNQVLLIMVIALTSWLIPARLIRAEAISLKHREYVLASRVMGARSTRTIVSHILPNAVGTIVVNATFQIADAILLIAYLSFLGLGIPPPAATWGGMLSEGMTFLYQDPWWLIYLPGVSIVLVVVSFNYLGDALRDAFDQRTTHGR
jgi:peptide/nickel transport system permease protein